MANGRKKLSATFAGALLAVASLVATPAPAQTGPGGGSYGSCQYDPYSGNWYRMYVSHWEPCTPYDDCEYDPYSGNWYRMYHTHWELCEPYGQSSEGADDRAPEPAGQ